MDIPTALRGRFVASAGFSCAGTVFLLADDSNLDVELQVHAPDMVADDFRALCTAIVDRLNAALVGLNEELIIEVHRGEEFNHFRVAINNPEYAGNTSAIDLVLATAKAIVQASELAMFRRVIALKPWQCAVLVNWDEPFNTARKEVLLTVPAATTGLTTSKQQTLLERIEALCDPGVMATVRNLGDTVEIALWSPNIGGFPLPVARAHVTRALFALGTVVELRGINNIPVVQLTHPFSPFVDDGSEPPERNYEY